MSAVIGKRGVLSGVADLVWPPRSLLSERIVSRPGTMEPELWQKLVFLSAPCCARCGYPFEAEAGPDALCGACTAEEPAYDRARAALAYDDLSRTLVLDIKRGWTQLISRRFNQAAWLAHAFGALTKTKVDLFALERVRRRKSQAGLDAGQRRRNVTGAYRVGKASAKRVKDKKLVLIDDVFTTGATGEACAKALKRAGAGRVDVLTLARVVRPVDVLI